MGRFWRTAGSRPCSAHPAPRRRPPEAQPRSEGHTPPRCSCRRLKERRLGAERPASLEARSVHTVARAEDAGIWTLAWAGCAA